MQYTKECGIVEEFWGRHAHISEVVDKGSSPSKIKRIIKVAQRHTSYQCMTMLEDITGIIYINGTMAIKMLIPGTSSGLSLSALYCCGTYVSTMATS